MNRPAIEPEIALTSIHREADCEVCGEIVLGIGNLGAGAKNLKNRTEN